MHQVSGKAWLGFSLALLTAVLWGMLPVALKMLLTELSANTITWVRFLAATIFVGVILKQQGALPKATQFSKTTLHLLAIAVVGLLTNYILFLLGVKLLTPETAQLVIQLAPFLMMLGGIVLFKEQMLLWQKVGAVLLVIGLLAFFNERLVDLVSSFGTETLGVVLVIISAITWAAYALAQKQLLKDFQSQQIMLLIYLCGAISFLPFTDLSPLPTLSNLHWGLLAFCCLNTIFAYGAFAEALAHWETSKVSAVLAITPLLTILFANLATHIFVQAQAPQPLNLYAIVGAVMVVLGSALTALAPQLQQPLPPAKTA
jgi:drug/metabolite transporter (DMT)-like permease